MRSAANQLKNSSMAEQGSESVFGQDGFANFYSVFNAVMLSKFTPRMPT